MKLLCKSLQVKREGERERARGEGGEGDMLNFLDLN